jgi:Domain of unknown function DUF29
MRFPRIHRTHRDKPYREADTLESPRKAADLSSSCEAPRLAYNRRRSHHSIRAMRISVTKLSQLYDRDFVLWTEEQAAALRRAKDSNLPLDWENLAEEIESLGRSDRRELRAQIRRILRHLFKLEASPATDPRTGWRSTILDARAEIEELLETSPSLRREVERIIKGQAVTAAELAANDLEGYKEPTPGIKMRLDQGGFTAEQVLGDWFPDPPR